MKKLTLILLFVISIFTGCRHEDAIIPQKARVNLTRNTLYEARWRFVSALLDSIGEDGKPYFNKEFPNTTSYYINLGLQSLNKENSTYLRTTEYEESNGPGFLYCYDTIQVQTWNNDSIICKIAGYESNDTIQYSSYTFHGKYNSTSENIEGFIYPLVLSYRCPTCPGKVYRYYEGKVPAMFIPINY